MNCTAQKRFTSRKAKSELNVSARVATPRKTRYFSVVERGAYTIVIVEGRVYYTYKRPRVRAPLGWSDQIKSTTGFFFPLVYHGIGRPGLLR